MTIFLEINGTTYEATSGGSVRELEDRLRIAASAVGQEVFVDVRADGGRSRALHILPGAIGTFSVWESDEHTGHQD